MHTHKDNDRLELTDTSTDLHVFGLRQKVQRLCGKHNTTSGVED